MNTVVKRTLTAILALAVAMGLLAGCGGSKEPDPNEGVYYVCSMGGYTIDDIAVGNGLTREEAKNYMIVELSPKKKCVLTMQGEPTELKWEVDGTAIRIYNPGEEEELTGTVEQGVMHLTVRGTEAFLAKEERWEEMAGTGGALTDLVNAQAALENAQNEAGIAETTAVFDPVSWWNGKWYGWWAVQQATGYYVDADKTVYDCYAQIDIGDNREGELTVWEYDQPDRYLTHSSVHLTDGATERGKLLSDAGTFFDLGAVGADEWSVDPGDSIVSDSYEDLIVVKGHFTDPDEGGGGFDYYIFLRPWGESWDDVKTGDNSKMLYTDMMPYHYEDWYLKQLEAEGIALTPPGSKVAESIVTQSAQSAAPEGGAEAKEPAGGTDAKEPAGGETDTDDVKLDGPPPTGEVGKMKARGGDGKVSEEMLQKCWVWLDEVLDMKAYDLTYDDVVAYIGAPGEYDKEEYSDHMESYYCYFTWYSEEDPYHTIYINFRQKEDQDKYHVSGYNISGFSGNDAVKKYLDEVQAGQNAADKAAAANKPKQDLSFTISQWGHDENSVDVSLQVPDGEWVSDIRSSKTELVNTDDPDNKFGKPFIDFKMEASMEKLDKSKDSFENYKEVGTRTIGGVEMTERTYKYVGYEWTEFVGQYRDDAWISVGVVKADPSEGTVVGDILDSISFK